jgi:Holin family.
MVAGIASIFAPAVPIVLSALTFIIVDLIFGYGVSRKYGEKHFESDKFWNTIIKACITVTLIGLGTILDKFILMTYADLILAKIAAGMVITAELISILESVRALYPNAALAKILSKVIKSKAEKYLNVDLSDVITEKK